MDVDQIKRGHADDAMLRALQLFSPYNTNKLGTLVNNAHKDYFVALNKTVKNFIGLESSVPKLFQ